MDQKVIIGESGLSSASRNHLITFADILSNTHAWDCVPR